MRDDTRGRVPFALLGVLLLVSSLTLAPTLTPDPVPSDTAVERTLDRASAGTQTAMRDGVATAGRRAAASPVLEPADTPAGRALNDSQPFRDALRLRVYLRVRDHLRRVEARSEGVEATASLPAIETTEGYRNAIDRVTVERAGENGTALRATVENVTLTARRGDRVLTRRDISPTVTVATPVLLLHDQMATYETRLHAPIEQPGLSQRLTARLYPMVWARGYAQFGGVPIENVLANRHVSLAANGALLGVQRSTFGRSDPNGRQALTEATAMTGVEDLVTGSNDTAFASELLGRASYRPVGEDISTGGVADEYPRANETMRVGVNETADAAFRTVAAPNALDETTADAYTVEVRLVADSRHVSGGRPDRPDPPGENWTLVAEETSETTRAIDEAEATPGVPDGWHELRSFGRIVAVEYTRVAVWESVDGNESRRRQTIASRTERRRVSVTIVGRHEGESAAPDRPITTAHDSDGSPVDGPNLADVAGRAERGLVDRAGGRDAVTERAADGRLRTRVVPVTAERPAELRAWVYRDLRRLRERVRAINASVERGAVGTFETNPARRLQRRLAERRAALVDAPATYDSAAQKARVAARIAYLDAVEERLAARANGRATAGSRVESQLQERTGGSLRDLRRSLTARETQVPRARPVPTGPAGPVRTRVDARPQYLTLASLDESRHPAVDGSEHPLVARNVNVFTVPYGDAADAVTTGATASADRTRLSTAATALAAANATAANVTTEAAENESLNEHRASLNDRVRDANDGVAAELRATVREETGADARTSRRIVTAGLHRWNSAHARGLALADGRAAKRVAAVAAERRDLSAVERDWLRVRLSGTVNDALKRPIARPREPVVNRTAAATRTVAREALHAAVANATEHRAKQLAKKRFGRRVLPAGLPIAPWLGPVSWYATTNLWWVTVEGEYARFAVTANHGTPTTPGATTTYVRDDATARLDVDDDGEDEVLGHNERLRFRVETGVVVVVGPKPRGVGDRDGQTVETSAGWPNAGK
ncbi:DUF7286 family protein [Haloarcula limicola]|uniref:DUF7286 family protein n=1 Tax=Haloarcula limicola TaxID=1429915 RepID=UPI001F510C59|nr:hypothetical protein [Halomicroarcula limicola]